MAGVITGAYTVPSFLVVFLGYNVASSLLQYFFYYRRAKIAAAWKIQPRKTGGLGDPHWWLPLLHSHRASKDRHPLHGVFATVNLLFASTFAGVTAECTARGVATRLHSLPMEPFWPHVGQEAVLLLLALAWQSVLEYVWHLGMHTRACYARLHKYHHYYHSPEPFDDMFIHPLEAFGYYCILYSPAYVLPMHACTFVVYMVVLGTFGVADHSGIRLTLPGVYATADHDAHHSRFEVNYAFPFPYLDLLFGTYSGDFLGRHYEAPRLRRGGRDKGEGALRANTVPEARRRRSRPAPAGQ